jgi:hypothetical protein
VRSTACAELGRGRPVSEFYDVDDRIRVVVVEDVGVDHVTGVTGEAQEEGHWGQGTIRVQREAKRLIEVMTYLV